MKKPYDFRVLSSLRCKKCGKNLKLNLTERYPDAEFCYKHYPKSKLNRAGAHIKQPVEVGSVTVTLGKAV